MLEQSSAGGGNGSKFDLPYMIVRAKLHVDNQSNANMIPLKPKLSQLNHLTKMIFRFSDKNGGWTRLERCWPPIFSSRAESTKSSLTGDDCLLLGFCRGIEDVNWKEVLHRL